MYNISIYNKTFLLTGSYGTRNIRLQLRLEASMELENTLIFPLILKGVGILQRDNLHVYHLEEKRVMFDFS